VPKRPPRDIGSPLANPEVRLMNESDLAKLDAPRSEQGCAVLSATPLVEVTPDGSRRESRPFLGLALNAELWRRGTPVIGATGSGKTYRYAINAIHAIHAIHAILRDPPRYGRVDPLQQPEGRRRH